MVKHAVQTPGDADPKPDAFTAVTVVDEGESESDVLRKQLDAQAEQIAALTVALGQINRNQAIQAGRIGEAVDLPDLATVMDSKPASPVMTKQGWYVPPTFGMPVSNFR